MVSVAVLGSLIRSPALPVCQLHHSNSSKQVYLPGSHCRLPALTLKCLWTQEPKAVPGEFSPEEERELSTSTDLNVILT